MFTALLARLRADELTQANVGDIHITDDGAIIAVHDKGNKDRRIPVGHELVKVLNNYLESRAFGFPSVKRRGPPAGPTAWPASAPLFVGGAGERITRGTLQYRVLRAFWEAGWTASAPVAFWSTDFAILSPRSWPTETSACTC